MAVMAASMFSGLIVLYVAGFGALWRRIDKLEECVHDLRDYLKQFTQETPP